MNVAHRQCDLLANCKDLYSDQKCVLVRLQQNFEAFAAWPLSSNTFIFQFANSRKLSVNEAAVCQPNNLKLTFQSLKDSKLEFVRLQNFSWNSHSRSLTSFERKIIQELDYQYLERRWPRPNSKSMTVEFVSKILVAASVKKRNDGMSVDVTQGCDYAGTPFRLCHYQIAETLSKKCIYPRRLRQSLGKIMHHEQLLLMLQIDRRPIGLIRGSFFASSIILLCLILSVLFFLF